MDENTLGKSDCGHRVNGPGNFREDAQLVYTWPFFCVEIESFLLVDFIPYSNRIPSSVLLMLKTIFIFKALYLLPAPCLPNKGEPSDQTLLRGGRQKKKRLRNQSIGF